MNVAKKEGKETIYESRYFDNRLPPKDRMVKNGHQTLGTAQMFAIEKSEKFGYCAVAELLTYNVGEVPQEDIVRKWGYLNGQEVDVTVDFEAEKQKWITATHKRLEKLETDKQIQAARAGMDTTKENDMSDVSSSEVKKATKGKPVTKVPPAAAKGAATTSKKLKAGKAAANGKGSVAKGKKDAKGDKPKAPAKAPLGSPGSLLASLELREGSLKGNLAAILCENKGKMVPIKNVIKAVYGNQDLANIAKLQMVIQGVAGRLNRKESPWHIERGEDAIGLKAGKKA